MSGKEAVLLVGHGGIASDIPKEWIAELKRLEAQRQARGEPAPSGREAELDQKVRSWPRTRQTDPYDAGLRELAEHLRAELNGRELAIAYNEFCAPSIETAVADLAQQGTTRVLIVSVMLTPGGYHSEIEIPEVTALCRQRYPHIDFHYLWPFDLRGIAQFLAAHVETARSDTPQAGAVPENRAR